jgi:putative flippase GtrA
MKGGMSRCSLLAFLCRPGIQRPARFAVVGAIGVVVQLGTLEALTALGCHYLWATGLAVEVAVLHNFMWHQRFTWRDRGGSRLPRLASACSASTLAMELFQLRLLATHAVVGRSVRHEPGRGKSADHRSLLRGELSRQRPMGISVACSCSAEE